MTKTERLLSVNAMITPLAGVCKIVATGNLTGRPRRPWRGWATPHTYLSFSCSFQGSLDVQSGAGDVIKGQYGFESAGFEALNAAVPVRLVHEGVKLCH